MALSGMIVFGYVLKKTNTKTVK